MSPKFYGSLWIVYAFVAGILAIGGVFSMLTAVVFGFVAFGLVFAGMICVLPGTVSHPPAKKAERTPKPRFDSAKGSFDMQKAGAGFPVRIRAHR